MVDVSIPKMDVSALRPDVEGKKFILQTDGTGPPKKGLIAAFFGFQMSLNANVGCFAET